MKYDNVMEYLNNLQEIVNIVDEKFDVRGAYDRVVTNYLIEKQPDLYYLTGEAYQTAKLKMREHCFNETSTLVNILLNDMREIEQKKLRWEQKIRKEIKK